MPDEESLSGATATNEGSMALSNRNGTAIEPPSTEYKRGGYHEVAEMMARYPATAVFKRFNFLNALNILYLQGELAMLEKKLREVALQNNESPDSYKQKYFQSFYYLSRGLTDSDENDDSHWRLILRIREVLENYSMVVSRTKMLESDALLDEAIKTGSQVDRLQSPSHSEVDFLREWIEDDGNNGRICLTSADFRVWDTPMNDMVALFAREYPDPISTWITETALGWYHQKIGYRFAMRGLKGTAFARTAVYDRKPVLRFVSILAVSIASLLPIVSITALNAMAKSTQLRLGFMSLFTVCFCALCSLFTGAKKTELLAASV